MNIQHTEPRRFRLHLRPGYREISWDSLASAGQFNFHEGFRSQIELIYSEWRDGIGAAIRRGVKQRRITARVDPDSVAAFVVTARIGIWATAKISQSRDLSFRPVEVFCSYLDGPGEE